MIPVRIASAKKPPSNHCCWEKEKEIFFPERSEKAGRKNSAIRNASRKARMDIIIDSPRNCHTRAFFSAPSTLRTPTSAERLEERAVARFIKLIQAISKVKSAMEARIYK